MAGLSYTTFAFGGMAANRSHVSFTLENTGKVAGAEVAQLYLGFPASAGEPPRQLKGFSKVSAVAPWRHTPMATRGDPPPVYRCGAPLFKCGAGKN